MLTGYIKERLENIIHEVAMERHWTIMALEVMPDHVLLFISVDPNTSPNSVVKTFKGLSPRRLREEFPELLRLSSLWTRSYFIFHSRERIVRNYPEVHREPDQEATPCS